MPYLVTKEGILKIETVWSEMQSNDKALTHTINKARAKFHALRGTSPKPHYKYDPAAFATYRAAVELAAAGPFTTYKRFKATARAELVAALTKRQG